MERINNQLSEISTITESKNTVKPDLVEDNYEIDLEEILGTENLFAEPETIDSQTGENITVRKGYISAEYYQDLETRNQTPQELKNALNITKTANLIVHKYGEKEGENLVANSQDYRISLSKGTPEQQRLMVSSLENNQDIIVADKYSIFYNYQDKDVANFQEYSRKLAQDKNRQIEH